MIEQDNNPEGRKFTMAMAYKIAGGFLTFVFILVTVAIWVNYYFAGGQEYENAMNEYKANEIEALKIYDMLAEGKSEDLVKQIETVSIPKFKRNLEIVGEIKKIEGLSSSLVERNDLVLKYSNLNLRIFELYKKTFLENSDQYDGEINELIKELKLLQKKIQAIEV